MIIANIEGPHAIANLQDAEALLRIIASAQPVEEKFDTRSYDYVMLPRSRGRTEIRILPGKVLSDAEASEFLAMEKQRAELNVARHTEEAA